MIVPRYFNQICIRPVETQSGTNTYINSGDFLRRIFMLCRWRLYFWMHYCCFFSCCHQCV